MSSRSASSNGSAGNGSRTGARTESAGDGLRTAAGNGSGGGTSTAAGNGFAADTTISLKRWLLKTSRSPFVTFSSLVQPVVFFVLMASVFGAVADGALARTYGDEVHYITFLTPGIVIQSALAAAAVSGIGLVKDMETGMFDKILVSPIDRSAMLLGKILSELLRIAVQTVLILVLGFVMLRYSTGDSWSAYLETGLVGVAGIVGITVLFSLVFVAFSNAVALVTRDEEATILIANLLTFPLLFVSSAFLPLAVLPDWIRTAAVVNPVTYGVDGIRAFMLGDEVTMVLDVTVLPGRWNVVVPAAAVLTVFALVLGIIAGKLLTRAWKADVQ